MALTGVGFTYRPGGGNEPRPIPEGERLRMFQARVIERVKRQGVRQPRHGVFLRRAGEQYGPYAVSELEQLWNEGRVEPTDEYWYAGMPAWQAVTEFVPPA